MPEQYAAGRTVFKGAYSPSAAAGFDPRDGHPFTVVAREWDKLNEAGQNNPKVLDAEEAEEQWLSLIEELDHGRTRDAYAGACNVARELGWL